MEFSTNIFYEFPDDQPPATSYQDPQKPGQMAPMNPMSEVPGTDASEVDPGANVHPDSPAEDEKNEENNEKCDRFWIKIF